ncbi:MAG: hypothetical protein U0841_13220 [Chloroflexia bacterium]
MQTALRRHLIRIRRIAPLLFLLPALTACLQRVAVPATNATPASVATVPSGFFAATPAPSCCPTPPAPSTFPGLYLLGAVEALPPGDPRAAYAAPLLSRDTKFVQIALQITNLREPHTPSFAYELITDDGVFGALASGEWDAAVPNGTTYRQDGVLLFVVPRDLRSARLEIVDYNYPLPSPGAALTLQRTIVVAFELPRFP